jgi:hypothetical protein
MPIGTFCQNPAVRPSATSAHHRPDNDTMRRDRHVDQFSAAARQDDAKRHVQHAHCA